MIGTSNNWHPVMCNGAKTDVGDVQMFVYMYIQDLH